MYVRKTRFSISEILRLSQQKPKPHISNLIPKIPMVIVVLATKAKNAIA
ncbi:hypothetical protein [Brunnivagina elsteri]|nr:hypothetical protein [Calothrix elsteri]